MTSDYLIATDGLAVGDVDATFAPSAAVPEGSPSRYVFDETSALLVRKDHPTVRRPLTAERYAELAHVDVEVTLGRRGVGHRVATESFRRAGVVRNVRVIVPYFTTAALIASQTDFVASVPRRAAERFCQMLPVRIAKTTFPLPAMPMSLLWHERTDADPGASYFRQLVVDAVGGSRRVARRRQ